VSGGLPIGKANTPLTPAIKSAGAAAAAGVAAAGAGAGVAAAGAAAVAAAAAAAAAADAAFASCAAGNYMLSSYLAGDAVVFSQGTPFAPARFKRELDSCEVAELESSKKIKR
jgi:hypothetical protein